MVIKADEGQVREIADEGLLIEIEGGELGVDRGSRVRKKGTGLTVPRFYLTRRVKGKESGGASRPQGEFAHPNPD